MSAPLSIEAACLAPMTYEARGERRTAWVPYAARIPVERVRSGSTRVAARIDIFRPDPVPDAPRPPRHAVRAEGVHSTHAHNRLQAGLAARRRAAEAARRDAVAHWSPLAVVEHGGDLWMPSLDAANERRAATDLGTLLRDLGTVADLLYAGNPPWRAGRASADLPRGARIVEDGREEAVASLRRAAAGIAVLDGSVYLRSGPPCLALSPAGEGRAAVTLASAARRPPGYAFALDRRDALRAFVEVARSPGGVREVSDSLRGVEHDGGAVTAFPEARTNARAAVQSALRAIRDALPDLDAGTASLLAELVRIREGLDAGDAAPADADAALATLDAARVRIGPSAHLGHAIRIGRAAIALSRPEPFPSDGPALASLAR
jgi:hypothetical protein